MKKKIAAFLCAVLMFATVAVPAFAAEFEAPKQKSVSGKTQTKADTKGTYENLEYEISDGEVTITGYVTAPEEGALVIPETIEGYPVTTIGESAFGGNVIETGGCESLTSVKMPSVQTIGDYAFGGCFNLTSVEMPQVQTIGYRAFYYCDLVSVEMPQVQTIGVSAFAYCNSLTSFIIGSDNENYSAESGILYNKDKSTLIAYPSAANDIKIADSVQAIGDGAFSWCLSLGSVEMQNVQTIGEYAFYNCESLTSVEMPNVQTIGAHAFEICFDLASIEMPNVQTIGAHAFGGSDYYNIPACSALTYIEMPKVQTIGEGAFYRCKMLTRVEMSIVQTISDYAFEGCQSLTSAYFYSDAPTSFGEGIFEDCADDFTIYYAEGTKGWDTPEWNGYPAYPFNPDQDLGDLNDDGKINTADAVAILKAAAEITQLDGTQNLAADVNHDGKVNTADAVTILKYAAGIITEF